MNPAYPCKFTPLEARTPKHPGIPPIAGELIRLAKSGLSALGRVSLENIDSRRSDSVNSLAGNATPPPERRKGLLILNLAVFGSAQKVMLKSKKRNGRNMVTSSSFDCLVPANLPFAHFRGALK